MRPFAMAYASFDAYIEGPHRRRCRLLATGMDGSKTRCRIMVDSAEFSQRNLTAEGFIDVRCKMLKRREIYRKLLIGRP